MAAQKQELNTVKDDHSKLAQRTKLKKQQLKQAAKEREARLATELEQQTVTARLEKERLTKQIRVRPHSLPSCFFLPATTWLRVPSSF